MKVTIDIPDTLVRDQLTSGFEQGIGYWCRRVYDWRGYDRFRVTDEVTVEDFDGKRFKLDFERAIKIAIEKYPRLLDSKLQDAETGDMFIQLAAFGKLVYG